jgi:flagellum-specific peptidoglycan hydrolase FlgJ
MKPLSRKDFIVKYYPFVASITSGSGVYIQTLFAQAILESQGKVNGNYMVGGSTLAKDYNNLFGIKADKSWQGKKVNLKTREVYGGNDVYITDAFRVYDSPEDSMKDYIAFLQKNPRYTTNGVFSAANYKDQAKALQRAGYATDPNYSNIVSQVGDGVTKIIKDNNLQSLPIIPAPGTIIGKTSIWLVILLAGAAFYILKK